MKAIRVVAQGGPEALQYVEVPDPRPGPGEVLIRIRAIGVNFLDVYHRSGLYPVQAPFIPGSEAAGTVEGVGEGVERFRVGDRVAYGRLGTYAELAVVAEDHLVPLPDDIDFRAGAAGFLQGITAHFLTESTYPVREGEVVLVHAAAGGVGALLVQAARRKGARVLGTASTAKLDVAREAGADPVIDYTKEDFVLVVGERTEGRGVDVVYDSVGRTTFDGSLECLRPRGMLVAFGQSSGPIPPFDVLRLGRKGLYLTRPGFAQYTADPEELRWRAREVFAAIGSGELRLRVDRELPLAQAAEAHRLLEGRHTSGKIVLIP